MKKLLFLILFPSFVFAQSSKMSSPMGNIISVSPGTTITQASSSTVFFSETIPANTFIATRWYRLTMAFKLTTPAISIPGISLTFQLGAGTFNLMTNAALVGGVTNGLFLVNFTMIATGSNAQTCFATITQPNGAIITLGTTAVTPVGSFAANNAIDNLFTMSAVFTGVGVGSSSLNNFWTFRDAF